MAYRLGGVSNKMFIIYIYIFIIILYNILYYIALAFYLKHDMYLFNTSKTKHNKEMIFNY